MPQLQSRLPWSIKTYTAMTLAVVMIGLVFFKWQNGGLATLSLTDQVADSTVQAATLAYVTITDEGFVPSTLQVTPGTTVIWTNQSATGHQVAADPYPSRSSLPDLYSQTDIAPGQSYQYMFASEGTYSYQDYLKPVLGGTVIVAKP